jgi:hypothetical protein
LGDAQLAGIGSGYPVWDGWFCMPHFMFSLTVIMKNETYFLKNQGPVPDTEYPPNLVALD